MLSGEAYASTASVLQSQADTVRTLPLAHLRGNLDAPMQAGRPTAQLGSPSSDALPQSGAYFLIAKTSDLQDFRDLDLRAQPLIEAQWVDHKTGTLPRQIALAAGRAPTESFSVYKVLPR